MVDAVAPSRSHARAIAAAQVLAGVVFVTAAVVSIGGWGFGVDRFIRVRSAFPGMAPSSAICLMLASACVLIIARARAPRPAILLPAAGVIGVIAAADLIVFLSGAAPGLEALIWPDAFALRRISMAPASAVCFLLAAVCLLRLARGAGATHDIVFTSSATLGLLIASVAVVAYAFDAAAPYELFYFAAMAAHTALAFLLLFVALMLLRPTAGWIGILTAGDVGSRSARRLLPVAIAAPLALSFLALVAYQRGWADANLRLSLLAIVMMTLSAAAVLRNAAAQSRAERMREAARALEETVEHRELLLREVNHRVKNSLQQINALLRLEGGKLEDPEARAAFMGMTDRIRALAAVHTLLGSGRPSRLASKDLLDTLIAGIADSHGLFERGIRIETSFEGGGLDLEFAQTLGLLVNELVTNALKHAFPDGRGGLIEVAFTGSEQDGWELTITDDGEGFAVEDPSVFPGTSAGAQIISGLVRQLQGELRIESAVGEGATVTVRGPFRQARGRSGRSVADCVVRR